MESKNLKNKAIDIHGKEYVLVSDRILFFNETYPDGCIKTKILTDLKDENIIVKAYIYPEGLDKRCFTGHSQETKGSSFINKTSALENAETSAIGRALGMMGIGVIDSIASVDEITKANNIEKEQDMPDTTKPPFFSPGELINQIHEIKSEKELLDFSQELKMMTNDMTEAQKTKVRNIYKEKLNKLK